MCVCVCVSVCVCVCENETRTWSPCEATCGSKALEEVLPGDTPRQATSSSSPISAFISMDLEELLEDRHTRTQTNPDNWEGRGRSGPIGIQYGCASFVSRETFTVKLNQEHRRCHGDSVSCCLLFLVLTSGVVSRVANSLKNKKGTPHRSDSLNLSVQL